MKKMIVFIALSTAIFFISDNLYAKIVVESTKGEVAYKKDRQWVSLTKGQTLEEGAKISTGAKSWAELNIDGDRVRIDQLTMMKVFTNKTTKDEKNTHIGLKHGSLKARVTKIGTLKTSFKITTPVATSSVRGSQPYNWNGAQSGTIASILNNDGQMEVVDKIGHTSMIGGNLVLQQSPNAPKSKNLLLILRNNSIPNITDPNATNEENAATEFTGLDTLTPVDNPGGFVPPSSYSSPPTTNVNVQINWPEY